MGREERGVVERCVKKGECDGERGERCGVDYRLQGAKNEIQLDFDQWYLITVLK